jgi:hypothetical protein
MFDFLHPASADWQSRQLVVTPELLGMRSVGDCQERALKLGLTPLPRLPYRQEPLEARHPQLGRLVFGV